MFVPPKDGKYKYGAMEATPPPISQAGLPCRRKFVDWLSRANGMEIEVRPQVWVCPATGKETMDEWQDYCRKKAAELAAKSEGEVLFYHTRAWRAKTEK